MLMTKCEVFVVGRCSQTEKSVFYERKHKENLSALFTSLPQFSSVLNGQDLSRVVDVYELKGRL